MFETKTLSMVIQGIIGSFPKPSLLSERGLFIQHHLRRHFHRYYFRTPTWKLLVTASVLGPLLPPIVLFRPSVVRFVSSNIYGAAPCTPIPHCRPALHIAKRLSLFFATMEEAMLFTL
jgi:hypothetical protein